jgi:hypothetical protein
MGALGFLLCGFLTYAQDNIEELVAALLKQRKVKTDVFASARLLASAIPPHLTPERRERLLRALPSLLEDHLEAVAFPGRMGVDLPEDFLREGYEIELEYLAARIRRSCRRAETFDERTLVTQQIHTLADAFRDALRMKFPGETAQPIMDEEAERLRRAWLDSLEKPLREFLDAPLAAQDLQEVLRLLRDKAAEGGPILLTADDVEDRETLGGKGARGAMLALRDAAYTAMARCYSEHSLLSARSRDWFQRCQLKVDSAVRSLRGGTESPNSAPGLPSLPSDPAPHEKEPPNARRHPAPEPPNSKPDDAVLTREGSAWVWILLALGISAAVFLRVRRSS